MANAVIDPQDVENPQPEDSEPGENNGHSSASSDIRPEFLRNAEEGGGFYHDDSDDHSYPLVAPDKDDLNKREKSQESGGSSDNKDDDKGKSGGTEKEEAASPGFVRGNFDKYQASKKKVKGLRGRISKNKWLVGFGAGSMGILILIILLILVGGAYKLVDFGEHIAAYQFARSALLSNEATDNIDNEAVSIASIPPDAAGSELVGDLESEYTADPETASLWTKMVDVYRPERVINRLGNDKLMTFNSSETSFGREYVSSISFDGAKGDLQVGDGSITTALKKKLIPGYSFVNDVKLSRDLAPQLSETLEAENYGLITRSAAAAAVREKLGISLVAWLTGKALGPSQAPGEPPETPQQQADDEIAENAEGVSEGETVAQVQSDDGIATIPSAVDSPDDPGTVNAAKSDAVTTENADLKTQDGLQAEENAASQGDESPDVVAEIASDVSESGLRGIVEKIAGALDPTYKWAVPMCLIYDGSIANSGPTMDANAAQTERTGVYVQTAEAQLKDGYTATGYIDGAFDNKIGNINDTYAEDAAAGQPFDTSNYQSTESSPTGQYSTTIADYLGPTVGGALDAVGKPLCPVLTNLWVAAGVSVAALASLAASKIADGAIGAMGDTLAQNSMSDVIKIIIGKIGDSASAAKDFAGSVVKTGVLVGGATLIAKQMVSQEAGFAHSGLATNEQYDNDAFCGTNIYANQIDQQDYYGAPLMDQELEQDAQDNEAQLASANASNGAYSRYLSVKNPDSLVSHLALEADSIASASSINSFLHMGDSYFSNPASSFSALLKPLLGVGFATAPATSVNTYCGNVQFGYTQAEKKLLDECPSDSHDPTLCTYQPLENQLILDNSGEGAAIASTYGECFDGSVSIGDMLAQGLIQRTQDGNIIPNMGLCSPDNLGIDNTANDSPCGSQGCGDLVFRYRVANMYNNELNQLTCEQTDTTCTAGESVQ